MRTTIIPLLELTAKDLMSTDLVRLTEAMPLRDAALLLLQKHVGGAPVVDPGGRCVGVLSASDFLRLAAARTGSLSPPLPKTCSFQAKHRTPEDGEVTLCTLSPGACPIQIKTIGPNGESMLVCNDPHCVPTDWQVVDVEKLPAEPVRQYMTADPVTATPSTAIRVLARAMIDAHIHRVIIVDEMRRPVGIVSSSDILGALAYAEGD